MSLASLALDYLDTKKIRWIRKRLPWLARFINRVATNFLASTTTPRPNAYSLWSDHLGDNRTDRELKAARPAADYLTWESVTNKQYFDLHIQPAPQGYIDSLPSNEPSQQYPYGELTDLFKRRGALETDRSSVFFMFFAQWFTDGFFRSNPLDPNKTTSNHNIDLAQIYGADENSCNALRSGVDGKLRSQRVNGEELPDYLGELDPAGIWRVKECYKQLPYIKNYAIFDAIYGSTSQNPLTEEQKAKLFATGLERGNAILGHNVIGIIFLREHNSICEQLKQTFIDWDDARLFHTARIINTVILMKLVIEDYVNHIAGLDVLRCDPSFVEKQKWYRAPWIAAEFNLLYRWHGLIPDHFEYQGGSQAFRQNHGFIEKEGLANILEAATQQKAGTISLGGVPDFMLPAEKQMIDKGRAWGFNTYNAYREHFELDRINSFDELTDNKELATKLEKLYSNIDRLELTVGLFAEKPTGKTLTGELQTTMVAYDAITQIYTNPLLAKHNFTEEHFTRLGMERIESTNSFQDLVNRHIQKSVRVSVAHPKTD